MAQYGIVGGCEPYFDLKKFNSQQIKVSRGQKRGQIQLKMVVAVRAVPQKWMGKFFFFYQMAQYG